MNVRTKRDKKLISEEKEELICRMYQENELIHDIASKVSCERHTVVRVLKRHKLYQEQKSKVHINNDRIQRDRNVMRLATQGLTNRQIAAQLNIGKSTVQKIIQQNRLNNNDHYYKFNENFFESIDTEQQAYWLGFLFADGCVTGRSICLELALRDRLHVENFCKAIQYNDAHYYYRPDNIQSIRVVIGSKKMVSDLAKFGCVPNKSLTIRFPRENVIPNNLIHHFMRGYFDGNGCINIPTNEYLRSSFSLVSNIHFLEEYQTILNKGIQKDTVVKIQNTHNSGIGVITLGGNQQVIKIFNYLYKDATIYLERKYEKFLTLSSRLELKTQKET